MDLIKTQNSDFGRDDRNNALINTNVAAFKLYKQQRSNRLVINNSQKEINDLKSEIADLKELVKKLIEEKHG